MSQQTILVADDVIADRDAIRAMLKRYGYRVLGVDMGEVALDLLEETHRINLLLVDVGLADMPGHEVARRAVDIRPGLAVLYMSGSPKTGLSHPLLLKPLETADLIAAVRGMLSSSAARIGEI